LFRGAIPIHDHQLSRAPPHLGYIADLAGFVQTRDQLGVSDLVVLNPRHLESPSNQSNYKLHDSVTGGVKAWSALPGQDQSDARQRL
jgi:hypothetical protein